MITPQSVFRFGALLALMATAMAAQTNVTNWDAVKALPAGTPVRIAAGSKTVRGNIGRITDDSLVMTSGRGQETFDRQQVTVVDVQKPSRRKRHMLIGLAVGTGGGLGIGIAARAKRGQLAVVPNSAIVGGFTAAGALLGTLGGAVIPAGGWREIYRK